MSRATACRFVVAVAAVSAAAAVARAAPKDEVRAAVQKLADAKSYAFESKSEGGPGGSGSGSVEKGGYAVLALTMRDNTLNVVKKGDKVAVETDDGWKSEAEMTDGREKFVAAMIKAYKTPAEHAEEMLADATEVKKGPDGTYTADLPEAAAKKLLVPNRRGGRAGGGGPANGPQVSDAKASVAFTLSDGSLTQMVVHVSGKVTLGDNDRDVDRTTTTTFKDVGSAKVDVPADAKAKLDAAAPNTKP